jgi:hypothetical protein
MVQVTRQAALTAEKEATDTESQYQQANAAMATYKASQTAWKACQAAEAAGEAEGFANEAASHARNARTAAALDHALGAAQAYNEVPPPLPKEHSPSPYTIGLQIPIDRLSLPCYQAIVSLLTLFSPTANYMAPPLLLAV